VALRPGERQKIYTRLAPVIGEEEAETLLDQFPSTSDAQPVTAADLRAVEARLDHRIDMFGLRLEAKIDNAGERLEKTLHKALRTQTIWMITMLVAVLGLAARTNIFG
jgi:hypothetical protein